MNAQQLCLPDIFHIIIQIKKLPGVQLIALQQYLINMGIRLVDFLLIG